MKKKNITHWTKNDYTPAVLLFAETIEELTFHYSYESYKLPALNCHYLCYDVISTAQDIERKVLMDGNFLPLAEEFEQLLQEDIFITSYIDPGKNLLHVKDKNSVYLDLSTCDLKTKIRRYPEIASFIKNVCETDKTYLKFIFNLIKTKIFSGDDKDHPVIYELTRMFISELVNSGYNKRYIYKTVIEYFFKSGKPVKCDSDTIDTFFNCFTFKEYDYKVAFGCNQKAACLFRQLHKDNVQNTKPYGKKALDLWPGCDSVVFFDIKSIDPYSAFVIATKIINTVLALHQVNQHDSKLFINYTGLVEQQDNNNSITVPPSINVMKKKGNSSYLHALFDDLILLESLKQINLSSPFYRAVALHNGAIESKDISNQLLNLWTIIEVLIDTKRDNEDKINTICTTLVAILNRCYIYSCLEQLWTDIRECSNHAVDKTISQIKTKHSDIDEVEKFALILSLEQYSSYLSEILSQVKEYPLLTYRINMYSEKIFKDSTSIYKHLYKHGKRIQWHIMRIYRNRNMIVHNGHHMPYINIIIENLHYYVDVLIETIVAYHYKGFIEHKSIYTDILNKETSYYVSLGISTNRKVKASSIELTEDNALQLIFNDYRGNKIKKALT